MQERQADKEKMHVQDQEIDGSHNMHMGIEKFWWVVLNAISFYFATFFTLEMVSGWVYEKYEINKPTLYKMTLPFAVVYVIIPGSIHMRYRGKPWRLIGRRGKAVVDSITLVAAIILRLCIPYDGYYFKKAALLVLVSVTLQLHSWGQSLRLSWDFCIYDVLLHVFMEVGTYISGDMTCSFLLFIFSCVMCYRYLYYSVPSTPESIKKDLELLPG